MLEPVKHPEPLILEYSGIRGKASKASLIFGPVLGVGLGLLNAISAAFIWHSRGEPDFYFRGWSGVDTTVFIEVVEGALLGAAFGAMVFGLEVVLRRKLRWLPLLAASWAGSLLLYWVAHTIEFRERKLFPSFDEDLIAIGGAFVLAALFSRPVANGPQ